MLFMGEEWGASTPWQYFTDHTDPELAEAVRRGPPDEFAAHGWARDDVPDPQARRDVRALAAGLGRGGAAGTHARLLGLVPHADRACATSRRSCTTAASTRSRSSTTWSQASW